LPQHFLSRIRRHDFDGDFVGYPDNDFDEDDEDDEKKK
jgi:hypothetical protein